MSQYSPPPPGSVVGPSGYGMAPAPQLTNGAAIGSLVCGIMGCVPWLTGVAAVILGIVGIRKTRDPRVGGKGMAIAGLILGGISIVAWTLYFAVVGAAVFAVVKGTAPQRQLAKQFLMDLSKQDVAAASAKTTSEVSKEELEGLADKVKPWGSYRDSTVVSVSAEATPGRSKTSVGGSVEFSGGTHGFTMEMIKQGEQWKIERVEIK
jgi:uncharacterized protein DUF4190